MCNCGSKRNSFTSQPLAGSVGKEPVKTAAQKMWPDVNFMYTGNSSLTATGYITGKRYRFESAGDKQLVDYRDAASMMKVPVLKRV